MTRAYQIYDASVRVFAHEARIYALACFPGTTSSIVIPEPSFIYTGYAKAFDPLIQYMIDPDIRAGMYGIQVHVCTQLVRRNLQRTGDPSLTDLVLKLVHLRRVLAVLKARGSDAQCITYNRAVDVLVSQIDRVL